MRAIVAIALLSLAGYCRPQTETSAVGWDAARVQKDLAFIAAEPHPMGSPRNQVLARHFEKEMQTIGLETKVHPFTIEVPDPELLHGEASMLQRTTLSLDVQNVSAKWKPKGAKDCIALVGSHYDSKLIPGAISVGANDSGSSSAVLLELMRQWKASNPSLRCGIMAVWFDAEEAYLPNWSDGETRHPSRQVDNTYGSRHFAEQLTKCEGGWCLPKDLGGEKVEGLILLDMVGDKNLRLSPDSNSTPELMALARHLDKELFGGALYGSAYPKGIEDDHIPFLQKGIAAVDLIGFEDLTHWHRPSDTLENVDLGSMEKASRLTDAMVRKWLSE